MFKTGVVTGTSGASKSILLDVWQRVKQIEENCSKVVDENGEPLVVYHGTSRGDFKVFSTSNQWGYGAAYFANNRAVADVFAVPSMGRGDSTADTQQVAAFARDNGYDGVIIETKVTM